MNIAVLPETSSPPNVTFDVFVSAKNIFNGNSGDFLQDSDWGR
jgi:hypothetical protein